MGAALLVGLALLGHPCWASGVAPPGSRDVANVVAGQVWTKPQHRRSSGRGTRSGYRQPRTRTPTTHPPTGMPGRRPTVNAAAALAPPTMSSKPKRGRDEPSVVHDHVVYHDGDLVLVAVGNERHARRAANPRAKVSLADARAPSV